jgi:hypothetical protein
MRFSSFLLPDFSTDYWEDPLPRFAPAEAGAFFARSFRILVVSSVPG